MSYEMDLKELNLYLKQVDRRVDTVEEAIKILTDLKISDKELTLRMVNLEDKIASRDKLFFFLLSPIYAGLISMAMYIFMR